MEVVNGWWKYHRDVLRLVARRDFDETRSIFAKDSSRHIKPPHSELSLVIRYHTTHPLVPKVYNRLKLNWDIYYSNSTYLLLKLALS